MKKKAFTLSEIIIAVAIIAIVSAIALPLVNKARPDKTKIIFLKTYDELVDAINTLASNNDIYGDIEGSNDYSLYPFLNTTGGLVYNRAIEGGNNKICRALALAYTTAVPVCTDDNAESLSFADMDHENVSFSAVNNVDYRIRTMKDEGTTPDTRYTTVIMFDINGADAPNCTVSAACQIPDRFVLTVGSNGIIRAADIMSQYYLDTRTNPRKVETSFNILNNNYTAINPIQPLSAATNGAEDEEGEEETGE